MALSPGKERFAFIVSSQTGLSRATVRAWIQAEGGPDDNPLNIARWSNGRRYFAGYGSVDAAAAATIRLLNDPRYAPVLRVARHPNATVRDELRAIVESPWEERHYTPAGSTGMRGSLMFGAYAALYPSARSSSPATATTSPVAASGASSAVVSGTPVFNPFDPFGLAPDWWPGGPPDVDVDPAGWLGGLAAWIGDKAALAFLYVALTVVAGAVIVLGLLRATGTSRAQILAGSPPSSQSDEIPF